MFCNTAKIIPERGVIELYHKERVLREKSTIINGIRILNEIDSNELKIIEAQISDSVQ